MQEDIEYQKREEEIQNAPTTEARLDLAINYMRGILAEGNKVEFRIFWKIKKICLDLFKEEIHPTTRGVYWGEYTKILNEAHFLQKMGEEQANFKIEQIALALGALENDLLNKEERIRSIVMEPFQIQALDEEIEMERRELLFLTNAKEKILALREEVLTQEIRIGQKNKLLAQISKAGDQVFPRRKDLIASLTRSLFNYVDRFIRTDFDLAHKTLIGKGSPIALKKVIRAIQEALKVLPINNEVYRQVRTELSACWDIITAHEKQKKEQVEKVQNEISLQNKEREKVIEDERKKVEESQVKVLHSIEVLNNLLVSTQNMPLDELEKTFQAHLLPHEGSLPKKTQFTYKNLKLQVQDLILSKKIEASTEEDQHLIEEVASHKEELLQMINDARKEITRSGLDIDLVMALKAIVSESKKSLNAFA